MSTAPFNRDQIFMHLPIDDLLRERECRGWDLAELQQSTDEEPSTKANGIAFIEMQIATLDHEIVRREQLRLLPGIPTWSSEPSHDRRDYWRRIKEDVLIPDFWDRYFPAFALKRSGRNWRGPCPIHGGKNETSMSIYNGGRSFNCFTCGLGGDVYTLGGLVFQTTKFREIADRLADEFGIAPVVAPGSNIDVGVSLRSKTPKPRYPEFVGGELVTR